LLSSLLKHLNAHVYAVAAEGLVKVYLLVRGTVGRLSRRYLIKTFVQNLSLIIRVSGGRLSALRHVLIDVSNIQIKCVALRAVNSTSQTLGLLVRRRWNDLLGSR
jgi:hypothetical protein